MTNSLLIDSFILSRCLCMLIKTIRNNLDDDWGQRRNAMHAFMRRQNRLKTFENHKLHFANQRTARRRFRQTLDVLIKRVLCTLSNSIAFDWRMAFMVFLQFVFWNLQNYNFQEFCNCCIVLEVPFHMISKVLLTFRTTFLVGAFKHVFPEPFGVERKALMVLYLNKCTCWLTTWSID